MDDYLEMEGLASRVVPVKRKGPVYVNTKITEADLFNENPSYSKTFQTGFKFRGINDKNVFYDETETRLIQNYRNTFINLAYYYKNVDNNNAMCIKTLDMMEKEIPRSVVDMDYRILYDVSNIYYSAGGMDQYKKIAKDIEPIALQNLNISMEDLQSPYNSFSMLERIYVNLKEYDKAIGILQKLQTMMPTAGGVTQEIDHLKQMKQADLKSDTTRK